MLALTETRYEGPHSEEDIYGRDYTFFFETGAFESPETYSSAHVSARIYPEREGVNRARLTGYWSFPPVDQPLESMTIVQAEPVTVEEVEVSAHGLILALELLVKDEVDIIHERLQQAALRIEG